MVSLNVCAASLYCSPKYNFLTTQWHTTTELIDDYVDYIYSYLKWNLVLSM
jgi:hypothetical protein